MSDEQNAAAAGEHDGAASGEPHSGIAFKLLIALTTVIATVSIYAVWANRQMLNAENWSRTSTQLLADKKIRTAISTYVTDQIYANIDVEAELKKAFPDQAQLLAGPAATGLRSVAQDAIGQALGTPVVQTVWEGANKLAMQQFINVVDEKNVGSLQFKGNDVKLDLRPAAVNLAGKVGLQSQAQQIPPGAAVVTVFSSSQISTIRAVAKFLDGVSILFPLLAVLLYALAVGTAKHRRRRALLSVGWSLVVAAGLALVIRNVAQGPVVDGLAKTDAVRPAVTDAYGIATAMISSVAGNTAIVGIALILAATLAGPMSGARAIREWIAPWLNDRPNLAYAGAYALLLLLVLWGPIPALRSWIGLPLFAVLTGLGVWALHRQVATEFPDATIGAQGESLRETWQRVVEGVSAGVSRGGDAARQAAGQVRDRVSAATEERRSSGEAPTAPVPVSGDGRPTPAPSGDGSAPSATDAALDEGRLERLERLGSLKASGVLTDAEFEAEKQKLLARG